MFVSFCQALGEDDVKHLKKIPGVWDAYEGVRALGAKLKVCQISGAAVNINPVLKSEFQQAPHSIREALEALEKEHAEKYGSLLASKLTPSSEPSGSGSGQMIVQDPRPLPSTGGAGEVDGESVTAQVLPAFENEAKVREKYNIVVECKAFDPKNVILLVSDKGVAFIYSKDSLFKHDLASIN